MPPNGFEFIEYSKSISNAHKCLVGTEDDEVISKIDNSSRLFTSLDENRRDFKYFNK